MIGLISSQYHFDMEMRWDIGWLSTHLRKMTFHWRMDVGSIKIRGNHLLDISASLINEILPNRGDCAESDEYLLLS